jgi:hypothetical protein
LLLCFGKLLAQQQQAAKPHAGCGIIGAFGNRIASDLDGLLGAIATQFPAAS